MVGEDERSRKWKEMGEDYDGDEIVIWWHQCMEESACVNCGDWIVNLGRSFVPILLMKCLPLGVWVVNYMASNSESTK